MNKAIELVRSSLLAFDIKKTKKNKKICETNFKEITLMFSLSYIIIPSIKIHYKWEKLFNFVFIYSQSKLIEIDKNYLESWLYIVQKSLAFLSIHSTSKIIEKYTNIV